MADLEMRVKAVFDRELAQMERDVEPSGLIEWLGDLRDEIVREVQR